jgi:aspartokinase-like uncharacterized kinase
MVKIVKGGGAFKDVVRKFLSSFALGFVAHIPIADCPKCESYATVVKRTNTDF